MKKLNVLFFLILFSCVNDSYQDLVKTDTIINLKWNKAYPDDTINKSLTGLQWALSYIGAKLPNYNSNVTLNGNIITIDIDRLGLIDNAREKLVLLNNNIKNSNEYKVTSAIDLGRYVTLLIGISEHYYEIVDVPNELSTLLNKYTLKPESGYINDSSVSLEHRIISFSEQNELNQFFISIETDSENRTIFEYETIEILPNGQLRFGIFDENGFRKNNASPLHTNAGKPAKCMWCHESSILPIFSSQNDFTGYLTYLEFRDTLLDYRSSHNANKNALLDGVDFSELQQHTLTELLYISFMEASAERLSLEWNIPIEEVTNLLSGISTHTYDEFPFLGDLYYRNEIEPFAPFKGLEVSSSVREKSEIEVNHIN